MKIRLLAALVVTVATALIVTPVGASAKNTKESNKRGATISTEGKTTTSSLLKNAQKGNPEVASIHSLAFGPKGLLLIGDGDSGRVVAVETGDDKPLGSFKKITDLNSSLAARFGLKAADMMVMAYAVNRDSGCAYFGLERQDDGRVLLARVKPDGAIEEVKLDDVTYACAPLRVSTEEGSAHINAILWTDKQVIVSATATAAFSAHVMSVPVPIVHDARGVVGNAKSYHVTHGEWETAAPLERMALWEENGETFIVAGLTCTPVVKYPLKNLKDGAELKGVTPFDFGGGQQPMDMFVHNGSLYVCVDGLEEPYVVRVKKELMSGKGGVNEKAPTITDENDDGQVVIVKKYASSVSFVPGFKNVIGMMQLSGTHALVLRQNKKNDVDLEAVALPKD